MRLIPGILAMLACVALAILNVQGYVRHLDTGDQAGFALGTFFLVGWLLPGAAVALLIGAIWVGPSRTPHEGRLARGIGTAALIAGAAFFLAYGLWMAQTFRPPHPLGTQPLSDAVGGTAIVAFSLTALACAIAVRPGTGGRRLLSGLILAISAIAIFQMVGLISTGVSGGMLAIHLPFMIGPTLVWIGVLLWSAWLLYNRKTASQQAEPLR